MTSPEVDDTATGAFFAEFGDAARSLPPVAIVIAAYNEADVIGQVIEALPAEICGLKTVAVVVSDGSKDKTAGVAKTHGALVADVPVNRGQGAALRLGYRLAREGGARYIVTTDADGQYNPAEMERCWHRWWPVRPTSSPDRASSAARRPTTRCAGWDLGLRGDHQPADPPADHRLLVRPARDARRR